MFCILNMLFYHPVSEATPDSKITGAYYIGWRVSATTLCRSRLYLPVRDSAFVNSSPYLLDQTQKFVEDPSLDKNLN